MNTLILVLTMGLSAFSQGVIGPTPKIPTSPNQEKKVERVAPAASGQGSAQGGSYKYVDSNPSMMGPPSQSVGSSGDGFSGAADAFTKSLADSEEGFEFDCAGKKDCDYSVKEKSASGRKLSINEVRSGDVVGRQDRISGGGTPRSETLHLGYVLKEEGDAKLSGGVSCIKVSGADRECLPGVSGTYRPSPAKPAKATTKSECDFPWTDDQALQNPEGAKAWKERCPQGTLTRVSARPTTKSAPSIPTSIPQRQLEAAFTPKPGAAN